MTNTIGLRSAVRFIPFAISLLIVIGNLFQSLPIWGFDYYILKLPYGSWMLSNSMILAIGLYPAIVSHIGKLWFHWIYVIVAIVAMAHLALHLAILCYFPWPGTEGAQEAESSIFASTFFQLLACAAAVIYLLLSLRLSSLQKRDITLIAVSIAISMAVAGSRLHHVVMINESHSSEREL